MKNSIKQIGHIVGAFIFIVLVTRLTAYVGSKTVAGELIGNQVLVLGVSYLAWAVWSVFQVLSLDAVPVLVAQYVKKLPTRRDMKLYLLLTFLLFVSQIIAIYILQLSPGDQSQSAPLGSAAEQKFYELIGPPLIAPVTEEFAFRGIFLLVLINVCREHLRIKQIDGRVKWSLIGPILVTSIVFGIGHQDYAGISASLAFQGTFSILMCLAFLESGSLFLPIILHSCWNFSIYLLKTYDLFTPTMWLYGKAMCAVIAATSALTVCCLMYQRAKHMELVTPSALPSDT